jgi:hypothetical protein
MHRWARAVRPLALVLTPWVLSACASPTLVERAIRARGGTLNGIARTAEADVYAGFPGAWRWHTVFKPPDRYAWSIDTAGEPNHYVYDGEAVRAFVGDHEVSAAAPASAPLTTHARFTAVAHLDVLRGAGVRIAELGADELPAGATAGLRVRLPEGATYRLGFDSRLLLLWLSGPANLQPLGEGELTARFEDFRRVHGYLLPYRIVYGFQGSRLADERATAVCPNPPGLDDGSFAAPALLPACE